MPPASRAPARDHRPRPVDAALLGEPVSTAYGDAWVRTAVYPLSIAPELAAPLGLSAGALASLAANPALAGVPAAGLGFVDTETTGLSTGTDTYTFLIGLGRYEDTSEGPAFVVRQIFMRHPAEEEAQLELFEDAASALSGVVSFNGRAFDLPLLANRAILNRRRPALATTPHLDLLPPARRLWRAHWGSCALSDLERNVLGVARTEEDVPGWMIPAIYTDYYKRGANVHLINAVFYHNLEDILSMVRLLGLAGALFERAAAHEMLDRLHPVECCSLARCYASLGWIDEGVRAYRVALAGLSVPSERNAALRDLMFLLKRTGRRAEAAELCEEWIGTVPDAEITPYVELAKYHEWHTGQLEAARGWVAWALHIAQSRPALYLAAERDSLEHRRQRLERKLAGLNAASPADE